MSAPTWLAKIAHFTTARRKPVPHTVSVRVAHFTTAFTGSPIEASAVEFASTHACTAEVGHFHRLFS